MTGFELMYSCVHKDLNSKNDLIVAVLHHNLIAKQFKCLGVGDNFSESDGNGSELLPFGWNGDQDTYVLRYLCTKTNVKLLVKCVKVSDQLIVSALPITGQSNGSTLSLRTDQYISDNFKSFKDAFTDGSVETISKLLNDEIIKNTNQQKSSQTETQQTPTDLRFDPSRDDPFRSPNNFPNPYPQSSLLEERRFPPAYGGADLDPLGRAQGGMLMDPRNLPNPFGPAFGRRNPAPGLPPGAVPPGARFDPFGPPGVGPNPLPGRNPRHSAPDPDHLPPPGYDDMFM